MPSPTSLTRRRWWLRIGLWVACVAAAGVAVLQVVPQHRFFDLHVYRSAMRWWVEGHALYDYAQPDEVQGTLGFTYPPAGAFLLRPLAFLSEGAAIALHLVLALACLAATVWWLVGPIARRQGWPRRWAFAAAFTLTLGLGPVWSSVDFGQINPLLWALVVLDLAVLGPRGSRAFGVGIGLATAIKLVPGIFVLYLLVSRRWRAAAVAAGTAVVVTLVAHLAAPADSATFWTQTVWGGQGIGTPTYVFNQSLAGALGRVFLPAPYPTLLWVALCAIVLTYGLWRARRAALAGDELAALALVGLAGTLVSPVSWIHHIFWFAPALLALVDTGLTRPRRTLVWVAGAVYVLVMVSPVGRVGNPFLDFFVANTLVWLMLALLVLVPIGRPGEGDGHRVPFASRGRTRD